MSTNRLFIAVPISDQFKLIMHDWSKQSQNELPFRRWVDPANYHITLKFLGETSPDQLSQIKERLHMASKDIKPFELMIKGLGCFGPSTAPSVFWASIQGDIKLLNQLQISVESAMETVGFTKEERAFHPHITLARQFKGKTKMDQNILPLLSERLSERFNGESSWYAKHINLYSSNPGIEPIYKVVESFELHKES